MKQFIIRWGPAVSLMAIIFMLSSIPKQTPRSVLIPGSAGTLIPFFDAYFWEFVAKKGAHLLIYALLAHTYLWGLSGYRGVRPPHLAAAALLAVLYGVTDELHQTIVPGREGGVRDVVINAAGACLGLLGWWKFTSARRFSGSPPFIS
jgi:VanZ family protein